MDSQLQELLGRNRLIAELLRAGLEVALPERDRGIDLIAYVDRDRDAPSFRARPIQMKASSRAHFSIDRKYEKFSDLILAFVWYLDVPEKARTYALSYREAFSIGEALGWTGTRSWKEQDRYSSQAPSRELVALLERYRTTPQVWWQRVVGSR
jgi:hypothetical protein